MSLFSVLRRRSVLMLVAAATGLAMPASAVVVPAASGASHEVVVKVANCEACLITLVSAPRPPAGGDEPVFWSSRETRVEQGRVSFRVPAAHGEGLYLTVRDRRAVSTGAMAIAVARYRGQRVGTAVAPRRAARGRRGFHCVAAVTRPRVVWRLRVDRFPGRDAFTGRSGSVIRPYLSPTQESFGDAMKLHRGVASAQDIAFCQRTP